MIYSRIRELDTTGLSLCKQQAELFSLASNNIACGSSYFARKYFNSSYALEFDNLAILRSSSTNEGYMNEFLDHHYENKGIRYPSDVMHWIGFIYRYWSYTRDVSSKQLYKRYPLSELIKYYNLYHSVDPEIVIETIKAEDNDIDYYQKAKSFHEQWKKEHKQ